MLNQSLFTAIIRSAGNIYNCGCAHLVAKDAYSFGLNYFQNDYSPINSTVSPFPGFSGLFPTGYSYNPLYNGNISAMSVNIGKLNNPVLAQASACDMVERRRCLSKN